MEKKEISWTQAFFLASGCSLLCLAALVFLFWRQRPAPILDKSTPWNVGGTLHRATVAQWRNATHENKLATAADWIASFLATAGASHLIRDQDQARPGAEALVTCMDEAVRGIHAVDDQKAYEIATGCWTIMVAQALQKVNRPQ